jgi:hypothetical protein
VFYSIGANNRILLFARFQNRCQDRDEAWERSLGSLAWEWQLENVGTATWVGVLAAPAFAAGFSPGTGIHAI